MLHRHRTALHLTMTKTPTNQIALIGLGTIGISMAALHLRDPTSTIHLFDTRPDIEQHIKAHLPAFLDPGLGTSVTSLISSGRIKIHTAIDTACLEATIVQEQGPEKLSFKRSLWAQVEKTAPSQAHFWSSTSGIPASAQSADMSDKSRLLAVHPFNPPHIMPLLEIVPSSSTASIEIDFACNYFREVSPRHCPVVINKEITGFVGNRLAFAVLREACYLVEQNVVSAKDIDQVMMSSLGPRWALNGLFESYHAGGGEDGIRGFLSKLETTVQRVWDELGVINMTGPGSEWKEHVTSQTEETYGPSTLEQTKAKEKKLRAVLDIQSSSD